MPSNIPGSRALYSALAGLQEDMEVLFQSLLDQIVGVLARYADANGVIPPQRIRDVQRDAGRLVDATFVGSDGRSPYAPDGITPLAPYPRTLNYWLVAVTIAVVEPHERQLRRSLPVEVFAWLQRPPSGNWAGGPFRPNPLAAYEPAHRWVDPNGFTLSDRIWRADLATRQKIDGLLANEIRQGRGSLQLSRQLEQFLLPNRAGLRTRKPYGTRASFDAMRLARTEITHAHGQALMAASQANPFVSGIDWALSGSHPKIDICDQLATIGMGGERLRDPYPVENVPSYPPHPQCVTPGHLIQVIDGNKPIELIQQGDMVLTHKGRFQRVLGVWNNPYKGLVYKFETSEGCFEVTPEHPILTSCGWVYAQDIQPGDQILHTKVNIGLDLSSGVPNSAPTQSAQASIAPSVSFRSVPPLPVAFDGDLMTHQCEVNKKTADMVLLFESDAKLGQGACHEFFNTSAALIAEKALYCTEAACISIAGLDFKALSAIEADYQASVFIPQIVHQQMDKTGIVLPLSLRDFMPAGGLFSGVIFATDVETGVGFNHFYTASDSARSIILLPCDLNALALCSDFQVVSVHQLLKHSELYAQDFANLRASEALREIKISEYFNNRPPELALDSYTVIVGLGDVVDSEMQVGHTPNLLSAYGASDHFDNLLSLSPDMWGTGSGKPVVERVASPPQAHLYYSTVKHVETRQYEGSVYNMHVEGDNSYTVNGFAVHNCICNLRSFVAEAASVAEQVQAFMANHPTAPYVTPARLREFIVSLLGVELVNQVASELRAA